VVTVERILPPDKWKERQLENIKARGEFNYGVGIETPKKDPIKAGIAAEGKFADIMKKVIAEERRKKGLEKTNIETWFEYANKIGKGRLVDGVVLREAKVADFINKWQPLLKDHVVKIDAMPQVTDADREKRMLENLRGLKALKGKA